MWIEPFARLVFIALLISFIRFPSLLWQVDQMNVNLVFLSFVLKLLYGCTHLDYSISVVLAVTTAPLRTLGCLSAFSAPRSWYPTSGLSTRVLLCVAPFHGVCIGRSRPLPYLSFLPHPFLVLVNYNGVRIERDRDCIAAPFNSRQSLWRLDRKTTSRGVCLG